MIDWHRTFDLNKHCGLSSDEAGVRQCDGGLSGLKDNGNRPSIPALRVLLTKNGFLPDFSRRFFHEVRILTHMWKNLLNSGVEKGALNGDRLLAYYSNLNLLILLHYKVSTVVLRIFDDNGEAGTIVEGNRELFLDNRTLCEDVLNRKDFIQIEDLLDNPTLRGPHLVRPSKIRFLIGYPILQSTSRIGAFCLIDTKPRIFSEQEMTFMAAVSSMV